MPNTLREAAKRHNLLVLWTAMEYLLFGIVLVVGVLLFGVLCLVILVGLASAMVVLGNSIFRHVHASHIATTEVAASYGALGGFLALLPMFLFWIIPMIVCWIDYKSARVILCWLCCVTHGTLSGLMGTFVFQGKTERLWESIGSKRDESFGPLSFLDKHWATCAGAVGGGIIGSVFLLPLLFGLVRVFFASYNFRISLPSFILRSSRWGNKSASQPDIPVTNLDANIPAINPPPPSYFPNHPNSEQYTDLRIGMVVRLRENMIL
ncbi:hypothetical protein BDQ12DRAFT_667166 [Crucibulum laeve]|uniref:Uncharacterized protein n=1 Tax=Crucibulum laeve TaxID=68775 RepID=A0A5C3LXF7_9AGAR|nr:hypothetical protein BDQ12DRAFT_667166 [Crucibulum laeve]